MEKASVADEMENLSDKEKKLLPDGFAYTEKIDNSLIPGFTMPIHAVTCPATCLCSEEDAGCWNRSHIVPDGSTKKVIHVACPDDCSPKCGNSRKKFLRCQSHKVAELRLHPRSGRFLVSKRQIKKGDPVIEYVGQGILEKDLDDKVKQHVANGIVTNYFCSFSLNTESVIDGTERGNLSRFANYSHRANMLLQDVLVDRVWHKFFIALRDIEEGEKLLAEYLRRDQDAKSVSRRYCDLHGRYVLCYCGQDNCSGLIGYHREDLVGLLLVHAKDLIMLPLHVLVRAATSVWRWVKDWMCPNLAR